MHLDLGWIEAPRHGYGTRVVSQMVCRQEPKSGREFLRRKSLERCRWPKWKLALSGIWADWARTFFACRLHFHLLMGVNRGQCIVIVRCFSCGHINYKWFLSMFDLMWKTINRLAENAFKTAIRHCSNGIEPLHLLTQHNRFHLPTEILSPHRRLQYRYTLIFLHCVWQVIATRNAYLLVPMYDESYYAICFYYLINASTHRCAFSQNRI